MKPVVQHELLSDAMKHHAESFSGILDSDSWMGVLWKVEDGKLILADKTSWNFPIDDFDKAIRQLRDILDKEKERIVMPEEGKDLPMADFLRHVEEDQAKRIKETIKGDEETEVQADGESIKVEGAVQPLGVFNNKEIRADQTLGPFVVPDQLESKETKEIQPLGISNMTDDQSSGLGLGFGNKDKEVTKP